MRSIAIGLISIVILTCNCARTFVVVLSCVEYDDEKVVAIKMKRMKPTSDQHECGRTSHRYHYNSRNICSCSCSCSWSCSQSTPSHEIHYIPKIEPSLPIVKQRGHYNFPRNRHTTIHCTWYLPASCQPFFQSIQFN
jgi:hypothetical protein